MKSGMLQIMTTRDTEKFKGSLVDDVIIPVSNQVNVVLLLDQVDDT